MDIICNVTTKKSSQTQSGLTSGRGSEEEKVLVLLYYVMFRIYLKYCVKFWMSHLKMSHKTESNKCWPGCRKIRTLVCCSQECKKMQLLQKTVWQFLKQLNLELRYDPNISTFTYVPKIIEKRYSNRYLYMNIPSSIYIVVYVSQKVETTQVYINR